MLLYITDDGVQYEGHIKPVSNPVLVLDVGDNAPPHDVLDYVEDFLAFLMSPPSAESKPTHVYIHPQLAMPAFEIPGYGFFLLFDDWQWIHAVCNHCNPLLSKEASKRLRLSGFFERICTKELGWSDSLTARVLLACQTVEEIATVIGTDVLDYGDTTPTFEELGIIAHGFEVRGEPRYAINVTELAPFLEE
jgi:hypothetical protein